MSKEIKYCSYFHWFKHVPAIKLFYFYWKGFGVCGIIEEEEHKYRYVCEKHYKKAKAECDSNNDWHEHEIKDWKKVYDLHWRGSG